MHLYVAKADLCEPRMSSVSSYKTSLPEVDEAFEKFVYDSRTFMKFLTTIKKGSLFISHVKHPPPSRIDLFIPVARYMGVYVHYTLLQGHPILYDMAPRI